MVAPKVVKRVIKTVFLVPVFSSKIQRFAVKLSAYSFVSVKDLFGNFISHRLISEYRIINKEY
jgi:hypothetical protein